VTSLRRDREAAFHDAASADDRRAPLGRFYAVASDARGLYRSLIEGAATGCTVLELGCGKGEQALRLGRIGATVHGVDVAPTGVRLARQRALAMGLADRVSFSVMDGHALGWPDATFDLVCGSGILHHLEIQVGLREIVRVLKSAGRAVFLEPMAHNPAIRLFRLLTPSLRSRDEHPLSVADVRRLRACFGTGTERYFGLTSLLAAPFVGAPGGRHCACLLQRLDRVLLRLPCLRPLAWMVVLELREPAKAGMPG